ncbi:quorum-sensing sensor histidine kinase AgrC [Staphylococcus shinii]|uniref:quorum-sensing sensor histidine kinase AgrC n=1 Tax=Staphylococcus shinii TaxID=2912228 RepID=UPI00192DCF06|nr:GHKL domain-containing protein [Staphylococcus shinii]QRA17561.1 GHKL domain-containing protein [Staphylococcus shinii]
MAFLNLYVLPIIQILLLIFSIKFFNKIYFTIKDVTILLVVIILNVVLLQVWGSQTLLILLIIVSIWAYVKNKILGILTVLGSCFILYISNFVTIWLIITILDYNTSSVTFQLYYAGTFVIIYIISMYIIHYFLTRLNKSVLSFNKVYLITVSLFLITAILLLNIYLPKSTVSFKDVKFLSLIFSVFIITIAILIITISFSVIRQIQYKRNMQEIENYYKYTLQIEKINHEMRKLRHDYVNILSTLSDFIREEDMEGLRDYFHSEILSMQDSMQMNAIKINGIENLHVREIKGLLTTKILQAQEKNIRISIEVPEPIEKIDMPIINLSRVIGILLDNAIEASEKITEDPLIRIAFIKNEDTSVTFIVMNKCEPDMPKVHTLFQENFSTKGKNRGLGLSTLKELTDSTTNVLLDTTIDNNYFIQKVEILNSDS